MYKLRLRVIIIINFSFMFVFLVNSTYMINPGVIEVIFK